MKIRLAIAAVIAAINCQVCFCEELGPPLLTKEQAAQWFGTNSDFFKTHFPEHVPTFHTLRVLGGPKFGESFTNYFNLAVVEWKYEVVTNWNDFGTYRVPTKLHGTNYVFVSVITQQFGFIVSNTVAVVQWHEKRIPVVLESLRIGTTSRVLWNETEFQN